MPASLSDFKKDIDARLGSYRDELVNRTETFSDNPHIRALVLHTLDLVHSGGKRVRPYIVHLAMQTEGVLPRGDAAYWSVLCALEIFHTFALIHDDIIDASLSRRSLPTLQEFSRAKRGAPAVQEVDKAYAMLCGDWLFDVSRDILLRDVPQERHAALLALYHRMVETVVFGQIVDVSLTDQDHADAHVIAEKNFLKTSSYTFIFPMLIGRALANTHLHDEALYTKLGTELGEAFQIRDDLLNCVGDPAVIGKDILTDIEEGQHTYITQYIFDHGTDEEKAILAAHFGRKLSESEKKSVREMIVGSKAVATAQERIVAACSAARHLVDSFGAELEVRQAWHNCIDLIAQK